jgi:hypothetical protein
MADGDTVFVGRQNASSSETRFTRSGTTPNVSSLVVANDNGNCVEGNAVSAWQGVLGTSESGNGVLGTSTMSNGVRGISSQGAGVSGRSENPQGIGVFGEAVAGGGVGVQGEASGTGTGVVGTSPGGGNGVYGEGSGTGAGVVGKAPGPGGGSGVYGEAADGGNGVWGEAAGTGTGVFGSAPAGGGTGVLGEAAGTGTGVIGNAPGAGNGVWGEAADTGTGVVGKAPSTGWAGFFFGNVFISGDLTTQGAKSAVLSHSDGSLRRMYALESPESWFEDLGRAEIVEGRAQVALDDEFAAMVQTDDYHVFLTPEGETQGLYVSARRPDGFEVREQQGGTGNLTFSYRIVARRGDIEAGRLQRIEPPAAQAESLRPKSSERPPESRY